MCEKGHLLHIGQTISTQSCRKSRYGLKPLSTGGRGGGGGGIFKVGGGGGGGELGVVFF